MTKKEKVANAMAKALEDNDWTVWKALSGTCTANCGCIFIEACHTYCHNCGAKVAVNDDEKRDTIDNLYKAFLAGKKAEKK
jgi:hypothetical protein